MIKATFGYELSKHAFYRLYERHPHIFVQGLEGKSKWVAAYAVLSDSIEDKSVKNNTAFMMFLHEEYGFDKDFHFFINCDVLFVGVIDRGASIITTTMICSQHHIPHLQNAGLERKARFGPKAVKYRNK